MTIDKRALREAAEKADSGEWSYEEFNRLDLPGGAHIRINGRAAVYCLNKATGGIEQSRAVMAHIAAFNPKVALALLDENLQLQREKDATEAVALALRDDMRQAREVMLPDRKSEIFWPGDASEFDILGYVIAVKSAIRAAGIKVKG